MSTVLLDVNVLIALLDADHVHHDAAHAWFADLDATWATCPITENGVVRILSQPGYPNHIPVAQAAELMRQASDLPTHAFIPCDLSLVRGVVDERRLTGAKQITDAYLLGLAVHHSARLATFDRRVDVSAVRGATDETLIQVPI